MRSWHGLSWGFAFVTSIKGWAVGGKIHAIQDGASPWGSPAVPSPHYIDTHFIGMQGHGSYISQVINITKTGIYTLKFLGGARGQTGAALPEKLAFVVEFNGDSQIWTF